MSYNEVFGGGSINPAQRTYLSLVTAVDVTLQWPTNTVGGDDVAADIIDVDATQPGVDISLSDARQVSRGFTSLFVNVGSQDFQVLDSLGATIVSPAPGTAWFIYLQDNTTEDGTWATFQLGATISVADAAALAGAGIKALATTLNQSVPPTLEAASPITWTDANRALFSIWTGGVGVLDLPTPVSVGSDWFGLIRNEGTGILTVTPAGAETIDSAATLIMNPGESAYIITDGSDWYTVGLGSSSTVGFDYVQIDVSGSGDFILSGVQLDRISYEFIGALTGTRKIVVPNTIQQYWVGNFTTGAFTFEVATAAQVTPLQITQNNRSIFYCDGTDVVDAETGTLTPPISIGQGGTSATNATDALNNLGGISSARIIGTQADSGLAGGGDLTIDRDLLLDVDNLIVELTVDLNADVLAFYDDDAAAMRKTPLSNIAAITVEDEGVPLATLANVLDFVGAGVVATGAGATKTITIDQIPASSEAGRILKGDGAGGWVEQDDRIIISAGSDLTVEETLFIGAGPDQLLINESVGLANFNSTGTVFYMRTNMPWRYDEPLMIAESSVPLSSVGTHGQLWVSESIFGANPPLMMYNDDVGDQFRMGRSNYYATLFEVTSTTTTYANISNFGTIQIRPQRRYTARVVIWYTQGGGDIKLQPVYTETPEELGHMMWQAQDASGTFDSDVAAVFDTEVVVTTMVNGQISCLIWEFTFQSHDSNVGTLNIQFAENSAVSTTRILEPSWYEITSNDNQS